MAGRSFRERLRIVRKVWATLGTIALVGFVSWAAWAYRASADAHAALRGDDTVRVEPAADHWAFVPAAGAVPAEPGLVFFAGALVDPVAYAPLARSIAERGHTVLLVALPRRGAFGGTDGPEILDRASAAMGGRPDVPAWAIGGHSKGGAVAARFALRRPDETAGLALIGTLHPRDFSIARLRVPVVKVLGSLDGVAELYKSEENRSNLPGATRWVVIEGGNHSQFGHYGFQPGDWRATISRERQQQLTLEAVLNLLDTLAATSRAAPVASRWRSADRPASSASDIGP